MARDEAGSVASAPMLEYMVDLEEQAPVAEDESGVYDPSLQAPHATSSRIPRIVAAMVCSLMLLTVRMAIPQGLSSAATENSPTSAVQMWLWSSGGKRTEETQHVRETCKDLREDNPQVEIVVQGTSNAVPGTSAQHWALLMKTRVSESSSYGNAPNRSNGGNASGDAHDNSSTVWVRMELKPKVERSKLLGQGPLYYIGLGRFEHMNWKYQLGYDAMNKAAPSEYIGAQLSGWYPWQVYCTVHSRKPKDQEYSHEIDLRGTNVTFQQVMSWSDKFASTWQGYFYNMWEVHGTNCQTFVKHMFKLFDDESLQTQMDQWGPAKKWTLGLFLSCFFCCVCGCCCCIVRGCECWLGCYYGLLYDIHDCGGCCCCCGHDCCPVPDLGSIATPVCCCPPGPVEEVCRGTCACVDLAGCATCCCYGSQFCENMGYKRDCDKCLTSALEFCLSPFVKKQSQRYDAVTWR